MSRLYTVFFLCVLISNQAVLAREIKPQQSTALELPLHVLKPSVETSLPLVFYLSGDGGWNTFNETVCQNLMKAGFPVLGFDSQKYFWKSRTPAETSSAISSALEFYRKEWKTEKFLLVGFSFGADIIPFIFTRLSNELQVTTHSLVLISPDINCDFEIHLTDMLNLGISKGKFEVIAELRKCTSVPTYCIFGTDENNRFPREASTNPAEIKLLPGDHHYDNNFNLVAEMIERIAKNEKQH